MNNFKALLMMQLKDKIDFSCFKSVKAGIFKVVLSIFKFVVITAIIYLAFFFLSYLRLVSLLNGIPQNFFNLVFTIMFILSIIVCSAGLVKNLYFTKDNALLLTFPVQRTSVFTSKLLVYYIYELVRNLTYLLPLFIAYGLINGLPFYFYFWVLLMYPIITAIPVVIGALLSIPLVYIINFVKQNKWLEVILFTIFFAAVVAALIFLISAIPPNINLVGTWGTTYWQIQDFLTSFNEIFIPFSWLATMVIGQRYGTVNELFTSTQWFSLLGAIGLIVAVVALLYLIVRPLYFKMASTPFEYKKSAITKKFKNKKTKPFASAVKKEGILNLRMPEKLYTLLFVVIGMPIAIFLLNQIYSAMDTRLTGANMAVAFNILMILLISLSSSTSISYAYSEEGASSYLQKTIPRPYLQNLTSKLVINAICITLSILVSVIIFVNFVSYSFWQGLLIFLIIELGYLGHLMWCAELDIMNPQTWQYQTTGTHVNNPNEIRATLYALLISVLFAFLTFFFIRENLVTVWFKVLLVAALFFALRLYLYVSKIKVYYKEK